MLHPRPLHMKTVLERYVLAEQPTERTTAVRLPKVTTKLPTTEPLLPLDNDGKQYLVSHIKYPCRLVNAVAPHLLWNDTLYHIERLCEQYYALSGRYPLEIVLPAHRYDARPYCSKHGTRRLEHFYPRKIHARPIPFRCDESATYEVLVRGNV